MAPQSVEVAGLPPLLTVDEAAELLKVSPRSVRRMCAAGQVFAVKAGSQWRINTARFLDAFGLRARTAMRADVEARRRLSLVEVV